MKSQVTWQGQLGFKGTTENGHTVDMDGNNGSAAPSPMELVLMAVGGCSSVDVVSILQKTKQDVVDVAVELEGTRVDAVPAVFSHIHLTFVVTGREVSEKHVARAVALSADKYCSVSLMLGAAVEVSHSFRIVTPE